MNTLDHAHLYLRLGFALLPLHAPKPMGDGLICGCGRADCPSPAKHPCGRRARKGVLSATKDLKKVERWFQDDSLNIGIATGAVSGIVVLDVDLDHGGFASLTALAPDQPNTWWFATGGGGAHFLFRHPGGAAPNSIGALGPGLDVRGDGGFIVAPPSLHVSGKRYEIRSTGDPRNVPLADAPDWLLKRSSRAKPAPSARQSRDWRGLAQEGVAEGGRNDAVARFSGHLLGRGVDPHVVLELMLGFNQRRCLPPLDDAEVARVVASIAARDARSRRRG